MNSKITEQHRSRPAYIYVRQSTNAQVLHHQESTERQYALRTMREPGLAVRRLALGIQGTRAAFTMPLPMAENLKTELETSTDAYRCCTLE